jgi:hypothetical protein
LAGELRLAVRAAEVGLLVLVRLLLLALLLDDVRSVELVLGPARAVALLAAVRVPSDGDLVANRDDGAAAEDGGRRAAPAGAVRVPELGLSDKNKVRVGRIEEYTWTLMDMTYFLVDEVDREVVGSRVGILLAAVFDARSAFNCLSLSSYCRTSFNPGGTAMVALQTNLLP